MTKGAARASIRSGCGPCAKMVQLGDSLDLHFSPTGAEHTDVMVLEAQWGLGLGTGDRFWWSDDWVVVIAAGLGVVTAVMALANLVRMRAARRPAKGAVRSRRRDPKVDLSRLDLDTSRHLPTIWPIEQDDAEQSDAEQPAEEPAEEPADEPAEQPADEPAEEQPADDAAVTPPRPPLSVSARAAAGAQADPPADPPRAADSAKRKAPRKSASKQGTSKTEAIAVKPRRPSAVAQPKPAAATKADATKADATKADATKAASAPARTPQPRQATKRQRALLADLPDRLAALTRRDEVADLCVQEVVKVVQADSAALVVNSLQGPQVLAAGPGGVDQAEVWGVRTLAELLRLTVPVRTVLDGDPLAAGGRTALLTAPVPSGAGSAGVLIARRRSARGFTASDQDALLRLGRACGARLLRTPERVKLAVSSLDPATRLAGRALLEHDLSRAVSSQPEHGLPATLVVVEVAGLARLRTGHGAAAADGAMARVAARVGMTLRIGDLMYRSDVDELAVLLPATDGDAGAVVAQRLSGLLDDEPEQADGLALRVVTVAVEESADAVLAKVSRSLRAAQVSERWALHEFV